MIIFNSSMLQQEHICSSMVLNSFIKCESKKLCDMIENRLTYSGGALFFNYNNCQSVPDLQKHNSDSLTEFEGSLNGVYLSDFYEFTEDRRFDCIKSYCDEIRHFRDLNGIEEKLVFIIKQIDRPLSDAYICFHLLRKGECYLREDLDEYDEPLILYIY